MQKRLRTFLSPALLIVCLTVSARASVVIDRKVSDQSKATTDLVGSVNKYKTTVEALIPIYERELISAKETLEIRKGLLEKGLVSKRDVEQSEQAVTDALRKIDETKRQLAESDQLIASARAELELDRAKPAVSHSKFGTYSATNAILRYPGSSGWTIAQASKVENFFSSTFARQLPISAFGQSSTHNRMGLDHRNSMDVALNPNSAEGKALINYLQSNGIPFLAFRSAVPGAATGAHIHVGYPSQRMT
jgi:hypothetical protein